MAPIQEIKQNPLVTILLALLVGAMTFIGASMNSSFSQLWAKLDRVTNLMMEKEASLRSDLRDQSKLMLCHDREIGEIKERLSAHLRDYDRENSKKVVK